MKTMNDRNRELIIARSKKTRISSMNLSKLRLRLLLLVACCYTFALVLSNHKKNCVAEASGVFEVNFASLVDQFGRDLREDCCAWQNESARELDELLQLDSSLAPLKPQQQPCDPSKCQLIIRICVKNYQTQVEPSQCTFGELSAQVLKPNEAGQFSSYPPLLFSRQQQWQQRQQDQLRLFQLARSQRNNQQVNPTNIHHQRMLSQQSQHQPPSYYQQSKLPFRQHQQLSQAQQQQLFVSSSQPRAMRSIAFFQPISFPFNFTWPGSFSLIIDAWFELPSGLRDVANLAPSGLARSVAAAYDSSTSYNLYKKQLIMKHSMHGWLPVKDEWTNDVRRSEQATLTYSYRVTCQPNYYGEGCNILCRPRDDLYGHYTCSSSGSIQCLSGWQGAYCLDPICSPDCHKDQGFCSRPNECQCRFGFAGPTCKECLTYPGCVHGYCNRPHECICREGWGGLLCDEDLNFCANHQPCKNDAICTNAFNDQGVGSYNCTCKAGFTGTNCELSLAAAASLLLASQQQQQQQVNQTAMQQAPYLAPPNRRRSGDHHQRLPIFVGPPSSSLTSYLVTPSASQQFAAVLASASAEAGSNQQGDSRAESWSLLGPAKLSLIYGLFVAGMLVLVVCLILRVFFERSMRARAQALSHAHRRCDGSRHTRRGQVDSLDGDGEGDTDADVATMQNQQNIYKSRNSIYGSADKVPLATGTSHDSLSSSANGTLQSACSAGSRGRAGLLARPLIPGPPGALDGGGRNYLHQQLHHRHSQLHLNQQQQQQSLYQQPIYHHQSLYNQPVYGHRSQMNLSGSISGIRVQHQQPPPPLPGQASQVDRPPPPPYTISHLPHQLRHSQQPLTVAQQQQAQQQAAQYGLLLAVFPNDLQDAQSAYHESSGGGGGGKS